MEEIPPAAARRLDRAVKAYRESPRRSLPREWLVKAGGASFCMDGLAVSSREFEEAVRNRARGMSSARVRRARNHLATLRATERLARHGRDLGAATVVRWYASTSCGLCTASLETGKLERLAGYLRRVNVTTTRPTQAILEAAGMHTQMMGDPLFPGFNGVVARLILQYQLLRSGMPVVVFDAEKDRDLASERALFARLMGLVSEACEGMVE